MSYQKIPMVSGLIALLLGHSISAAEYTVGVVPQFAERKIYTVWSPILKALGQITGDTFVLRPSASIPEFEKSFDAGEYDFAYMNPWHAVRANEAQGYTPLVRSGSKKLQGILVVKKDSGITELGQLEGRAIAFPAPNALGASLLMRTELSTLHKLKIKPKYVKTHTSVYLNVALGSAVAGGGVKGTFNAATPELRDLLTVLYQTRTSNPHPLVAHPRVPSTTAQAVQEALIGISKDPVSKVLTNAIPMPDAIKTNYSDYSILKGWGLDEYHVEN